MPEGFDRMAGISRYRLLSLDSPAPLNLHLNETTIDSDISVRFLMKELEDPYVIMIFGPNCHELARDRLGVLPLHVETAMDLKYNSRSIPALTNLIVWDFWSISYPLLREVISHPWKQVDIFAVYFDWGAGLDI